MIKIEQQEIDNLYKDAAEISLSRSDIMSDNKCDQLLDALQKELDLASKHQALLIIALLCQNGGCAKACSGNMSITIFNREFKLASVRQVFSKNGEKHGLRKFARTNCHAIGKLCEAKFIPGHLTRKINRMFPDERFSKHDRVYLSDFHAENPAVDMRLRKLINESFKQKSTYKKLQ